MLKYPGILTWPNLRVNHCLLCNMDVSCEPICPSCQEKTEREVVEFLGQDLPNAHILTFHKMMAVVLLEEGNN